MIVRLLWPLFGILILTACGGASAASNNQGNQLVRQGNYDNALHVFQSAQVRDPDNALLYFNASRPLIDTNEFDEAIATLQQAALRGDDTLAAQAYHNIGNIYFQQSMYTQAIEAYKQALILNPDDTDTRYNLELAILFELQPTPTALEQKVEPEESGANPSVTPSPNPGGDEPTPTPTPPQEAPPDPSETPVQGFTGDRFGATPSTPLPRPESTLSIEQAERQLDSVQQDQRTLREFQQTILTPEPTIAGKDW